ncbi:hypothetical protein NMY22_g9823 [Coprinellus aureogranulatus]|nr:hypothetical protein NMY22_g9823 [Coprinellus aureogranulatus]
MTIQAAASLGLLLIAPLNPPLFLGNPCLSQNFLGHVKEGQTISSIFRLTTQNCVDEALSLSLVPQEPHILLSSPSSEKKLVWLEQEDVEQSLLEHDQESRNVALAGLFSGSTAVTSNTDYQQLLSNPNTEREILYSSEKAILLAVPSEEALWVDSHIPRFWKSTIVPDFPSTYRVVSGDDLERVKHALANMKFNPVVAAAVNNISIPQIWNDVRFLTGEDGKSGIISRHSFTPGALTAANWIKNRIEDTGARCRLEPFLTGFAPNVICRYESIIPTNDTVIISGHYDSRGSFGSARAPGGDDDGSGTTGILSIARTIARRRIKFHANVELCTFAGEEQGLLGSRAYAKSLRAQNATVVLMIQADMTAYRAPGEPLQLGLPELIAQNYTSAIPLPAAATTNLLLNRDFQLHKSFERAGPSRFFIFPYGRWILMDMCPPVADPMYHNSGDLSEREGYDVNQLYAIAKVQFASVLHVAGFEIDDEE